MIEESLNSLDKIRSALQGDSCIPKGAFLTLGDSSKAPSLNYNLPQSTNFQSYGDIRIPVDAKVFKNNATFVPKDNIFDKMVENKTETVKKSLRSNTLVSQAIAQKQSIESDELSDTKTPTSQTATDVDNTMLFTSPDFSQNAAATISKFAEGDKVPIVLNKFGGYSKEILTIKRPDNVNPSIFVVEEYTTASFLGDYGAGKVLNTFSLLPGEKTTISVKTYRESNTTRSRAENLLDSFSESSANEMENLMQEDTEVGTSDKTEKKFDSKVSLEVKAKLWSIGSLTAKADVGFSNNSTASRMSNAKSLSKAMDKHVAQSNSNRQVNVNTSSTESVKEGEEQSTVRELLNLNKSRTLNFVFRQMTQEYISLTYLSSLKIVFSNGYPESMKVYNLEDLEAFLEDYIASDKKDEVRFEILKHYCNVLNYQDEAKPFLEEFTVDMGDCFSGMGGFKQSFWRIKKDLKDSYTKGGLEIKIPKGVILTAQSYILSTDGVVVDSFLGQGEALDCFNTKMQDAEATKRNLENLEMLQRMEVVEGIKEPNQKAEFYKKVFGTCCDTPQTQILKP